ncbi:MAG: hypothetical protein H6822_05405 [Planctomycetaceae bacterium]|nr:hypothetical protein [Planctomycetales bacterium]MCB9921594.1 hypothetical protein [Planctomycetaceae bacterium]
MYARLLDREAVNDAIQNVALAALRQASPLLDASKIAPWLYRLAIRQVVLFRRKFGRQQTCWIDTRNEQIHPVHIK